LSARTLNTDVVQHHCLHGYDHSYDSSGVVGVGQL